MIPVGLLDLAMSVSNAGNKATTAMVRSSSNHPPPHISLKLILALACPSGGSSSGPSRRGSSSRGGRRGRGRNSKSSGGRGRKKSTGGFGAADDYMDF